MTGELKKMVIEAYTQADYSGSAADTFEVMFNPNGYTKKYELEYEDAQGAGSSASPQVFGKIKPQDYNFEFLFDGTGTAADEVDVNERIEAFLTITGKHDGEIHRPKYLKLIWGSLIVKCVLKAVEISYSLFKHSGNPLRARLKATFTENIEETLRVAQERENSPDLTHIRTVKQGNNLPLMSYDIYNETRHYIEIARKNNLKNFRRLKVGEQLKFLPINNKAS